MTLGVLCVFRNPSQPSYFEPWSEFYGGGLEHIEEMERLGFDAVNFAEHHGDPDGYNPVLLAEQLAVLDILSGRRIHTGFGQVRQTFNVEFPMLGVNPKHRPLLFEGGLEIIRRGWADDDPFDYRGKRYNLDGVWINPEPLQDLHPPMYVVAPFSSPPAMDRVARMGLDVGAAPDKIYLVATKAGMTWQQSAEYMWNFIDQVAPAVCNLAPERHSAASTAAH